MQYRIFTAALQHPRLNRGLELGSPANVSARLSDAAGLLAEALAIALGCRDPHGISRAQGAGLSGAQTGAFDTARRHWHSALDVAWHVQDRSHLLVTLDALIGLATLMGQAGDAERAVELLVLVRNAARIDHRTETQAEQLLTKLEARVSPAMRVKPKTLELTPSRHPAASLQPR